MMACFGPEISSDRVERGDRLLEEVFELLQSGGYDPARVVALRDYVWGREAGEPFQEVGGVQITLAAYCLAHDLNMHEAGEAELARIWTKVDKIRAKQAAKPVGSALPVALPTPQPVEGPEPVAVPPLERYSYLQPRQFLLLCSYCGGDTEGCSDTRPCAECLAMCNVFDENGKYLRQFGQFATPPLPAQGTEQELAKMNSALATAGVFLNPVADGNGAWHYEVASPPVDSNTLKALTDEQIDAGIRAWMSIDDRTADGFRYRMRAAIDAALSANQGSR
jgi:hypothetical protein